ncbi:hypothetical protein SAMN05216174_1011010 [Actinokineospora iranica]|uniref:Prenyltransferase and squalene oxidase repeat-containing protein n=2 Tax=Actinokineospora iranica TaxID=1271860 RepID=A0A1G6KNW2_9PSEU|nr:hypothetical protein SAMN05216174_1011010 [Actinokineospora iranica]
MRLAETFILRTARILERRRFEFLFGTGAPEPVLTALAAYRNPDGGYGNALEPDGRGPGSQPVTVLSALHILHEAGAKPDDAVCDYLDSITAPDGGVPFVHPNALDYPRAPWWAVPETYEGSLLPTANLVATLWRSGVTHPWVDRAAAFCWPRIESLTSTHPYEALACVTFLDAATDRPRAAAAATHIGALVRESGHVRLGAEGETPPGYNPAELHTPHEYAPTPDSLARHWFTDAEMEASLNTLITTQHPDGGWRARWAIWTPVTEFEWAGVLTIESLKTLRAYNLLPS